ncbi:unnamed protein product [Pleuronectes platessa]|uniref:Uncharacterized protein n=1 Tax=Pleuronectes platessa TaxID=8262 RepID=A0A9N7U7Y2_PLEPL|nr:unnamed protein product [Pleuronectes platessa]
MSAVQLLRVSVHERIRAAAEHFLLRLEKGEEPARVPALRAMLTERLTAEIVAVFEETVAEYEDRVERSEREVCRQRRLLDAVMKPEVRLHRADVQQLVLSKAEVPPEQQPWSPLVDQEDPEPPHIKEEQEELWTKQEGEADIKFTLIPVAVKSEEDEETPQSSQLHQSQTEENRANCGGPEPEPARNSGPEGHLEPGPETEESSETADSEGDWMETREPQPGCAGELGLSQQGSPGLRGGHSKQVNLRRAVLDRAPPSVYPGVTTTGSAQEIREKTNHTEAVTSSAPGPSGAVTMGLMVVSTHLGPALHSQDMFSLSGFTEPTIVLMNSTWRLVIICLR